MIKSLSPQQLRLRQPASRRRRKSSGYFKPFAIGRTALLVAACWLCLAGCTDSRLKASPEDDQAPPVRGGTIKVIGGSDVDHMATTSSYTANALWLFRAFTRQLTTYPASTDFEKASSVVADLATELPTLENGGISPDGLTYTFHLRPGVRWDSNPPREVTAGDVVLGMKLLCNPVNPTGAPGYYEPTIMGMKEYCDAFAQVPGELEAIRSFVTGHRLQGVQALDDRTVLFKLAQPSPDFLNLLAMPFASPVPQEYLNYLPDSPEFRQRTISDGPYRITKYISNREIQLERNPVWDAASDPLRPAYADHISVTLGIDQQLVQLQLEAATADLSFDHQTEVAELASLLEIADPNVILAPPGNYFAEFDYMVINTVGPNNGGALKNLKVRRALEYAVDKAAVAQVWGGPQVARPLRQAAVSSATGYRPDADMYATPGDRGDPEMAKRLLAEAGFANGISFTMAYPVNSAFPLAAQSIQESLRRAGMTVEILPYTSADFWSRVMPTPENARRGTWDLAITSWIPDWFGRSNGRTVIEPIFDGRHFGLNTMNFGGYNNDRVNAAIDLATAAPNASEAEKAWFDAARRVLDDAGVVPLIEAKFHFYRSSRTRNCQINIFGLNCDLTSLWIKDR